MEIQGGKGQSPHPSEKREEFYLIKDIHFWSSPGHVHYITAWEHIPSSASLVLLLKHSLNTVRKKIVFGDFWPHKALSC